MKRINPKSEPPALAAWIANELTQPNPVVTYDNLDTTVAGKTARSNTRSFFENEQRGLCGYTGESFASLASQQTLRVKNFSHNEHLYPNHLCRLEPGYGSATPCNDIAYTNLIAAVKTEGLSKVEKYGADAKDKWYDATLFISPLAVDCESRFRYLWNGAIVPSNSTDLAAIETIDQLKLDLLTMRILRHAAIKAEMPDDPSTATYTVANIQDIIRRMEVPPPAPLPNFAFVIAQIAKSLLPPAS